MDTFEQKCFYNRTKSELVDQNIANSKTRHTTEFGQLVLNVFNHMSAIYLPPDKNENIRDLKVISYKFYKEFYIEPKISLFGDNQIIPLQSFIRDTMLDKSKGHKNKFSFLIGNVGVGKTSVINYIITYHKELGLDDDTWFIRLDIDKTVLEHYFESYHIINSFVEKVCRVISNNPEIFTPNIIRKSLKDLQKYYFDSYILERMKLEEKNELHNIQKILLKKVIKLVQEKFGKKLIIIFDNIDILFYHSENSLESKENSTLSLIKVLVELFLHDRDHLGELGANLLFVMRTASYRYLHSYGRTSGPIFTNEVYTIIEPPWNEVINVRYSLLREIIKNDANFQDKKDIDKEINKIYDYLMNCKIEYEKLIDHIRKLTNNGLRELMEYFRNYGWISEIEKPSLNRFNAQTHIGLISFILNGRKLYTQINSLIPNIFLNCMIPSTSESNGTYEHPNTYWLKYYIIQYSLYCHENGEGISEHQIYNIFTNSKKSYPIYLVKEIIEVLCNPNRFSMLQRTRTYIDTKQYDVQIIPTPKAYHIFKEFCFKFFYLQLVLDDYLLALPRALAKNALKDVFDYIKKKIDYTYISYPEDVYGTESIRIVSIKAKSVLYFIQILETSHKFESEIFSDVFNKLKELNIPIPNIKKIKEDIRAELIGLNKKIKFALDLSMMFREIENDCKSIHNIMENCYRSSINEREMQKKMDNNN